MNILVKECVDNNFVIYVIDTNKINLNIPFENDYFNMLLDAIKSKNKSYVWSENKKYNHIEERFGNYSDGCGNFEKLLIKFPLINCLINEYITIFYM